MHSRRRLVVLAFVGALVATAGCTGFLSSATTDVVLVNNDEASHEVTVAVLNDGAVVYSEGVTADANSNSELETFEGSGEYTVAVTVDGETTEQVHEFTEGEDTLSIGVQNDQNVVIGG
jgi:hypothetical protein